MVQVEAKTSKPQASYTFLAIYCAFFQSKKLTKSAKILFDEKMYDLSCSNLILAIEELSKIKILSDLFLEQIGKNPINEIPKAITKRFFHHEEKIEIARSFFIKTLENKLKAITINFNDKDSSEKSLEYLTSKDLTSDLNELKKCSIYTNVKKNEVHCPLHNYDSTSIELLDHFLKEYDKFIRIISILLEKLSPKFFELAERYHSNLGKPSKKLEKELIRIIKRIGPSLRFSADTVYTELFGVSMIDEKEVPKDRFLQLDDKVKTEILYKAIGIFSDLHLNNNPIPEQYY